ncbi:hypothetical protein [Streptomyces tateyamensis]|uniref:hypothetical protein n=1 Tax=Streptomyces tateyamensis TaxID=565073 RepID=UPI000DA1CBE2|nr:hypothetical protein [Streptomyces tateyamensis]
MFFDGVFVSLVRHRTNSLGPGSTRIPIPMITELRWREAGRSSMGALVFATAGEVGEYATAGFDRTEQPAFETLRNAVAQAIAQHHDLAAGRSGVAAGLRALADLLRDQLLTPAEYQSAKALILGSGAPAPPRRP